MSRTRTLLALTLAVVAAVLVGLRLFPTNQDPADQPVYAQVEQGAEVEPDAKNSLADPSAGSSEARGVVAPLAQKEPSASGLLHGTLYDLTKGERVLFAQEASIVFAPATSAAVESEGEGDERMSFFEFTLEVSEDGETVPIPSALTGQAFPVLDGKWSMPTPVEDLVAVGVTSGEESWRLIRGRHIEAGASVAVIDARAPLKGTLHVTLQGEAGEAQGIAVVEAPSIPRGQPVRINHAGLVEASMDAPDRDRTDLRSAPVPPVQATEVAHDTTSPVSIPMREYHREVWVGKPGYQWERVTWKPSAREMRVELRPVGRFEIELHNADNTGGAFDLRLLRDRRIAAHWGKVMGDGIFPAKDLGAGEYRVLLRRNGQGGKTDLYDSVVTVVGGETRVLEIDVAALGEAALGGLRLKITPPAGGTLYADFLAVVVSPKSAGAGASAQGKHHALQNMPLEGNKRLLQLNYLPGGDYQAHLFPSSIVREFTVESGETTDMAIDLSNLAEITVWPVLAEGEPGLAESSLAPGRMRWRVMESEAEALARNSGTLAGIGEVLLPATWSEGAWRLLSAPGEFSAVVEPYGEGAAMGSINAQPVVGGPNDLVLELKPQSGFRLEVLIQGAPQDWGTRQQLAEELLGAVRPSQGEGGASFVSLLSSGKAEPALLAHIDLTAPGEYILECSAEWASKLVPDNGHAKTRVKAGELARLRLNWQE